MALLNMDHSIRSNRGISPNLGLRVYVDPAATVIGNVSLGDDVSVWPGAVIRGDMHSISIGARSNIQDNAVLHITHASHFNPAGWPLSIGEDVVVGHLCCHDGSNLCSFTTGGIGINYASKLFSLHQGRQVAVVLGDHQY